METHLSAEVLEGLRMAQKQAALDGKRLRVVVDEVAYPVLRSWAGGFSLAVEDAPNLRGTVEFCDGTRVLHECLIVCCAQKGGEMIYEYKRLQRAEDSRPLDFVRAEDAPVALLSR